MFKRIKERCVNVKERKEVREDLGFVPSHDEILLPEGTEAARRALRELHSCAGEYLCRLCPKKVILNQRDLNVHLSSRTHRNKLVKYY
jgi:hypothetical protein